MWTPDSMKPSYLISGMEQKWSSSLDWGCRPFPGMLGQRLPGSFPHTSK